MKAFTVNDAIPAVCTIDDVCRILQMSKSHFFALRAKGLFPIPELEKCDGRVRFSGKHVERYINGDVRRSA